VDNSGDRFLAAFAHTWAIFYPDKESPKPTVKAYWHQLKDLPIDLLEQAFIAYPKRGKFFPKPAEIRELIEGSTNDNATEAFRKAAALIGTYSAEGRYIGADNPPVVDDPKLQRTLDLCWADMCMKPYAEQHWVQKRFEEIYCSMDGSVAREQITNDGLALPNLRPQLEG
jgi:hypothetical protein